MRKYGVFNTNTGLTERVDTLDQALALLAGIIAENVVLIKDRCPITVIDIAEDGIETWRGADGIELSDVEIQRLASSNIRSKYSWADQ